MAELFDISCLYSTPQWHKVSEDAYALWEPQPNDIPEDKLTDIISRLTGNRVVLGQHYFVPHPSGPGAPVPKFDFTSALFKGNPNAYAVMLKADNLTAPTGPADVDWLLLNKTSGELADQVFRVETKAGQPPVSVRPDTRTAVVLDSDQPTLV